MQENNSEQVTVSTTKDDCPATGIVCEVCGHVNSADSGICEMCSNYLFTQKRR